jgi:DeoR/GlpR family transcriptional regulator of sugar metabolism
MIQQEFCQICHHKHDCRQIYRQLGHAACPSVVRKVVIAFLLPLLVFIISLAIFDKFFIGAESTSQNSSASNTQELIIVVSFIMALLTTSVFLVLTKKINKRLNKDF